MEELVSIVMPNYNGARFLEEAIQSVISQTYPHWELLVVDDCSTDGSCKILCRFSEQDGRIRPIFCTENGGAAKARNLALAAAKGKWIAFLDSDDMWLPEKLERQLAFMKEHGYAFSYTKYRQIDEGSRSLRRTVSGPKVIGKRKMFCYNYAGCLTVMYDAERMGVLQIDPAVGNGRNDYALWLKAVRQAKCYYLDELLALYRVRTSSLSHGKKTRLIKTHYDLMRISEKRGRFVSACYTVKQMFYGALKKIFYVKKERA